MKSRKVPRVVKLALLLLLLALPVSLVLAQSGGPYDLSWSTVDGGGNTSSGGDYTVSGTAGQADAGGMSGGVYGLEGGFWNGGGHPTAVTLLSFAASPAGGAILLEWETASEVNNLGFNLYRAESAQGPSAQINGALIPSQAPGSPVGALYSYLDGDVETGVTYYYWLEDVDASSGGTMHGPVSTRTYVVYLPAAHK